MARRYPWLAKVSQQFVLIRFLYTLFFRKRWPHLRLSVSRLPLYRTFPWVRREKKNQQTFLLAFYVKKKRAFNYRLVFSIGAKRYSILKEEKQSESIWPAVSSINLARHWLIVIVFFSLVDVDFLVGVMLADAQFDRLYNLDIQSVPALGQSRCTNEVSTVIYWARGIRPTFFSSQNIKRCCSSTRSCS